LKPEAMANNGMAQEIYIEVLIEHEVTGKDDKGNDKEEIKKEKEEEEEGEVNGEQQETEQINSSSIVEVKE